MTGTFTNTEYGIIACVTLGFDTARHAHVALRTTVENTVFDPAMGFSPPPPPPCLSAVGRRAVPHTRARAACRYARGVDSVDTGTRNRGSDGPRDSEFPLKTIDVPSKTYE